MIYELSQQPVLASLIYILYLGFFVNFIFGRSVWLKLIFGLPVFIPVIACYLFAPTGNLMLGLFTAIFLFIVFFTRGNPMRKLFLSTPLFGPALLIFLFAPIYKTLFASFWIISYFILFFTMIMIALKDLV